MTPGSPKPDQDKSLADGASHAEAARPVRFDPAKRAATDDARPNRGRGGDAPDAAELAGTKRKTGDDDPEARSEPGAVAPKDVTTETDDGAG